MKKEWTWRKRLRTIWVICGLLFTAWMVYSYQAQGVDASVLRSSAAIAVSENDDYYQFTPTVTYKQVLIFYPGALVQTKAYAPLCRKIAEGGVQVTLIKMPWRLAKNGYQKPKELNLLADTSKQYILAGHSQGAKMAAQFVYENPGLFDRLILIATTHPRDIDLSRITIPVMKIFGSKDGVADTYEINNNKVKLPAATKYVLIKGANHAQFGYYGFQLGDHRAGISREEQQRLTTDSILAFIHASPAASK